MPTTKSHHVSSPTMAACSGRRLLLLAMLTAPLARTHAADIRIVRSEVLATPGPRKLRKILVLGWSVRQDLRQLFENAATQKLRGLGAGADASYKRLPAGEAPLRDAVSRVVKTDGYDGVLVARLIATERSVTASSSAPGEGSEPTLEGNLARLETPAEQSNNGMVAVTIASLYRVDSGARVWSALTDVRDPKDLAQIMSDYASVVVGEMQRHKFV